jgi:flagellar hook-associated protein 1
VSLNGIMSTALSSLQTNTSALKVVSQNISNLNTDNYARRQVNLAVQGSDGIASGVTIEDVTRVTDQYLTQENLSATSSSAQYDTMSSVFDQINTLLGSPGDGNSLSSKLSDVSTKLGAAQLSTNSSSSQAAVVNSMKSLASSISNMSTQLDSLSSQTDQQLSTSVTDASTLIKQIYNYNQLIKSSYLQGDTDTTYLDQRDTALNSLAKEMDIRVIEQSDNTIQVTTQDGISLVGSASYSSLSYTTGGDNVYGTITAQDTNGTTGDAIGTSLSLDSHLTGGTMRGLIDMRDSTIASVKNELGSLAKGIANAYNEVHNESSSYPPPSTLTGHNTGLLASDSLNFTGASSIALTDASGVQQHMVDIDFDAGTISVDGSSTSSFSNSIGSFTSALNDALSSEGGTADFTDGVLTVDGGSNRVVVGDPDSTNASSRSGTSFSQFFGLNDLFTTSVPSISNTGMVSSDALGLTDDGAMKFVVKNADGSVATTANVAITSTMTVDDAISAINTSLSGYATVKLDDSGALKTTMDKNYSDYSLQVTDDTTLRGSTGVSVSALFGLGSNTVSMVASGFKVNSAIVSDSSRIAFAQPDLSSTATQTVGSGDSNGLLALQALETTQFSFDKVGNLGAQTTSLQNYSAAFYQDIATQSSSATTNKTTQDDRLTEAQSRLTNNSGVNLDEELSNMIIYQKAYSAGARVLSTVTQLYDTLLNIQ